MFQQLQKSFVKSAMLSFTIVLFVVLVIVNGINYRQTIEQVDRVATMLVENNGTFPDAPSNEGPKEHPSPLEDTCLCTPGTGTNKGQEECGLS